MNTPLPRRNTAAEQRHYDRVCERLSGFDGRLHFESVDGLLASLAAAPRVPPPDEWLPALLGDAFDRAFADPQDREQALAALQSRLGVLCSQLDPQALFDEPDLLRLDPLMADWSDAARAASAEEPAAAPDDAAAMQTGAEWAAAFLEGVDAMPELWRLPGGADAEEAADACARARERVAALTWPSGSDDLARHVAEHFPKTAAPSREDLVDAACYAVQDLRLLWVDYAPRPQTRRVEAGPGRNDPCPCGSGRKYKKCCGAAA